MATLNLAERSDFACKFLAILLAPIASVVRIYERTSDANFGHWTKRRFRVTQQASSGPEAATWTSGSDLNWRVVHECPLDVNMRG
jgi:hypothetical protein